MKKLPVAVWPWCVMACLGSSMASMTWAAPEALPSSPAAPQADLKDIRQQIQTLSKEIKETEEDHSEASDALRQSEIAISQAKRALASLTEQKDRSEGERGQVRQQIQDIQQGMKATQERIARVLRNQHRVGESDVLKQWLDQKNPNQSAREQAYQHYLARAEHQVINRLREQLAELQRLSAQLASENQRLQKIAGEQQQQTQKLEAEKQQREQLVAKLSNQIRQQQQQIGKLQADEKRLTQLIEQINREIERKRREEEERRRAEAKRQAELAAKRKAEEAKRRAELAAKREAERRAREQKLAEAKAAQARAAARAEAKQAQQHRAEVARLEAEKRRFEQEQASQKAQEARAAKQEAEAEQNSKTTPPPEPTAAGRGFAALKGKMRLPTSGAITGRFGTRRGETSTVWKGIFIQAPAGQAVRVVAEGRVVYADWLRGFGNMVIVDHGNSYMSIYGGAEALLKQIGDRVRAGDTIATTGASGGAAESGLYFELRHLGQPINPQQWVGG